MAAVKSTSICDLALVNGQIVTVDGSFSIREAVAIGCGRIMAVGSAADIKPFLGADTEIVDLQGKTVLPGINDAHTHTALWAGTKPPYMLDLGYPTVRSVADIAEKVREQARRVPAGEWIRGTGWDTGYLDECRNDPSFRLDKRFLDEAAPDHPVALVDFSVHSVWVNSKALELAGVTRDTEEPVGGTIEKDPATGDTIGLLREFPAVDLIMSRIPPLTRAEKRAAIELALAEMTALGITSITEAALGPGGAGYQGGLLGPDCIGVYQDLLEDEELRMRVNILYLFGEYGANSLADFEEVLPVFGFGSHFGNDKLKIGGIKIFSDGTPPNYTAWMGEEYIGGGYGSLVLPGDTHEEKVRELENMVRFAHEHGFQVGVHCVGDKAVEATLGAFVKAETARPRGLRHYLMHVDFITAEQAAVAAEHGFGINISPALPWTISDLNVGILGVERVKREWPYRWVVDAGCHVSSSSDAPCTYPSWLQGVECAVLRETKATGKVYSPDQRLTVEEAIRTYTIEGAWQDRQEGIKGSIELGKLADLCVLSEDILRVDPHEIHAIENVMTVMDGEVVYDKE